MAVLGYIASLLIGVSLGLIGSGGSILTVPVLVYLMGMNPLLATTSSLFIVGGTSLVGGFRAWTRHHVDFRAVISFGLPSVLSIFFTRHYLLPAIPDTLFYAGDYPVNKDMFLMVLFAVLMLASSWSMIRKKNTDAEAATVTGRSRENPVLPVVLGLLVGVVTGLLGAGGGFLIIPALVLLLRLPMKKAVGTSLFIIAVNSLLGFLFSFSQFTYNWRLMLIFTVLAVAGLFAGARIGEHIPGASLKKGFGWFVLFMGIYIVVKELLLP